MGPSGSGKTTLMNIIGCLDTATSGTYYLNEKLVNNLSDDELSKIRNKEIGFVFQSFHLLARNSALNNVMLPLRYAGFRENDAIKRATEVLKKLDYLTELITVHLSYPVANSKELQSPGFGKQTKYNICR